jgi:uncharacterized protein
MANERRTTGDFCWINVLTPDVEASKEFFSKTLGWTYGDLGGMGSSILIDGHGVGGLFDLAAPNTPPGTPPLIGVMVKSDDADATVERANAVGGNAKPAFDIGDAGRMAEIKDPSGAHIDIWQPKKVPATDADKAHHGAPSWFENYATDAERAAKFYTDLFGWKADAMTMGNNMTYTVLSHNGVQIAGMMSISEHTGDMPPTWMVYFTSDDIDNTARVAAEAGGTVFVPPMDIPEIGRFAGLISPQGVRFFAISYKRRS